MVLHIVCGEGHALVVKDGFPLLSLTHESRMYGWHTWYDRQSVGAAGRV